jgi:phage shock protein A
MGIFSRTRDIVAANVSDLLSKSEDPAQTIRVIILEMEETLVEVRASAARSIADQKEMRRQIARLEELEESWTGKAELALSKDRDDLARAALVEREKVAEMGAQLNGEIALIEETLRASEADILKLQAKLREARSRQSAIAARIESAQNRTRMRQMYAGERVEEAFSGFDLLERRADHAEGEAEALALAAPPRTLAEEIADLRSAEKIDAELERMKAARSAAE